MSDVQKSRDRGGGRHPGHLDHGEDLRHLALHRPRVDGQEDPVNSCPVFNDQRQLSVYTYLGF